MKKDIHPVYKEVAFTCSCGNVITVGSTIGKEKPPIDICGNCHPFYTGKQKLADVGGRLHKFRKKYGDKSAAKDQDGKAA